MLLFSQQFITTTDFIVAPILFLLILLVGYFFSKRRYGEKYIEKYFIIGLTIRLIGSISLGLLTQYYYGYSDTYYYHKGATNLNEVYFTNIENTLAILWKDAPTAIKQGFNSSNFCDSCSSLFSLEVSFFIMKIGGLIGFLTMNTHLGTSLIFACFSFLGSWKIFKVFYGIYPSFNKYLAPAILFFPSVNFWSSGYTKESIVLGCLGFLFHSTFMIFVKRKPSLLNGFIFTVCSYLMIRLKLYIFIAITPALLLWISLFYINQIKKKKSKKIISWLAFFLVMTVSTLFYQTISKIEVFKNQYSIEIVAQKVSSFIKHYKKNNTLDEDGEKRSSNFTIGDFEPTLFGMLKKAPHAITAAFYRPYLWEVRKKIIFFAALESSVIILLTLLTFFTLINEGFNYFFRNILDNPIIIFCLLFSMTLGFIIGISTPNFGTLMRHRIPILPFLLTALLLLNYSSIRKIENFIKLRN